MDVKKNSFFHIGILYRFFKILHRLDLFPVDLENDISFLKANLICETSILNIYNDHTMFDSGDPIAGSQLRCQFLNPCPQFFFSFFLLLLILLYPAWR